MNKKGFWQALGLLVWLLPGLALAALPTVDLLKKNLAGLGDRQLAPAEQQTVQQAMEQTLVWLEQAERTRQEQRELEQQLAGAAAQISKNRQTMTQLLQTAGRERLPQQATAAELEQQVAAQLHELSGWQQELGEANALIVRTQTRPERAQLEITTNQKRLQEISAQLKSTREGGKALLLAEREDALNAELEALQAKNRLRQAELAANSSLQDLVSSNRELLALRVRLAEERLQGLQTLLSEKRQAASELTVQEQSLGVEKAGEDALLLKESNLNLRLSDYLLNITERRNQLSQKAVEVRQQLDNLQQMDRALDEQISVLQGSLLLAKILYQQKQALPQLTIDRTLAEQIADTRLNQFELRQLRENLQRPDDYVEFKLAELPEDAQALRTALSGLVRVRSELVDRLNHEMNAYLSEAIAVQLDQKQLQTMAVRLRAVLDEQMFWVPSNKPLDGGWLKALPKRLVQQIVNLDPDSLMVQLWRAWTANPAGFLPALLLTLLVLWKRNWLCSRVRHAESNIGHYLLDRQHYTPVAVLSVLLLILPLSAWLGSAGWLARLQSQGAAYELGNALINMARLGLVFSLAYRLLTEGGVAQLHLQWPADTVRFLRRRVAWISLTVWLLALLVPLVQANLSRLGDDVLGMLLLAAGLLVLSALIGNLLSREYSQLPWFARLAGWTMALVPLVFVGALVAGYYYTVLQLSDRLLTSLALLMLWFILRALLERGLTIAARRLAWHRAQRQQEQDGTDGHDEQGLDLVQANEQSLRLARFMLLAGFVVMQYWVWADVISLLAYLDNVVLYESNQLDAAGGPISLLSLRNLMNALVIVGMTVMLARNLPGLLEVLFLSRFRLTQGSSYAVMRLVSYSISSIGIVATLAALGVSWNKLQWLVAALSLGLGFGLQEIFANFVSGLIILFEKPVRIGDLVTIGDMTGTVSRIRIRAITITEFDRKESIIPNKVFVTERLLNWSLSDSVTRITLHIRLAYDADLELARKLMLETMQENSRILEDPEPVVLFLEVGPSSFNHEMRYHVGEISDRNPSIDEVHNRLIERFRAAGIQMAFQQMDVHIRSRQGDEMNWSGVPMP